jgi:hypothetical protein
MFPFVAVAPFQVMVSEKAENRMDLANAPAGFLNSRIDPILPENTQLSEINNRL